MASTGAPVASLETAPRIVHSLRSRRPARPVSNLPAPAGAPVSKPLSPDPPADVGERLDGPDVQACGAGAPDQRGPAARPRPRAGGLDGPAAPPDHPRHDPARPRYPGRPNQAGPARIRHRGHAGCRDHGVRGLRNAPLERSASASRQAPGGSRDKPAHRVDGGPSRAHPPHVAAAFARRPPARPRRIAPGVSAPARPRAPLYPAATRSGSMLRRHANREASHRAATFRRRAYLYSPT